MAKGRTLWEMLTARIQGPVEFQYYNPLHARIGTSVLIDEVEWKPHTFFVQELREYRRTIGGQEFRFADYVLLARVPGAEDVRVRLRLYPVDDPIKSGGLTHDALLLHLYDEMAYDKGLYEVVNDTTRRFQVMENGQVTEEYERLHGVTGPYQAVVSVLRDVNQDSRVDPDEVSKVQLEYWDYIREVPNAAGQPVRQYLFVEMDADSGWFQLWRGQELNPEHVQVF
jgi:hypothetical protein